METHQVNCSGGWPIDESARPRHRLGEKFDGKGFAAKDLSEGVRQGYLIALEETRSYPGEPDAPEEAAEASVPVKITGKMKRELRALGHTTEQIEAMTPQEAHEILSKK
jgi:hypothetical protein